MKNLKPDMKQCKVDVSACTFVVKTNLQIVWLLQLRDYHSYANSKNVVLVNVLWEASKVYSSISSHCMNPFPSLHAFIKLG